MKPIPETNEFKNYERDSLSQLKLATRCFIVKLNPHSDSFTSYYSVYTQNKNGEIEILWGNYTYCPKFKLGLMLPHQKHSNKRKYPAFHFSLKDSEPEHELATSLRDMSGNPLLDFYMLTGFAPNKIQLNDFFKQ